MIIIEIATKNSLEENVEIMKTARLKSERSHHTFLPVTPFAFRPLFALVSLYLILSPFVEDLEHTLHSMCIILHLISF